MSFASQRTLHRMSGRTYECFPRLYQLHRVREERLLGLLIALSNLFGVSIDYLVLGTATFIAPDSAVLKADIQALIGHLEKFRERL